jgi:hypothetical protein
MRLSSRSVTCLPVESETIIIAGERLIDETEDVGAGSEQLTAQHNRAASADGECSLLFAFLQHFIILLSIIPP